MKQIRPLTPRQMYETCGERINDATIRTRLEEVLGGVALPTAYDLGVPVVPMAPYLATPIRGASELIKSVEGTGLIPLLLTYAGDKYSTLNAEKVDTVRPRVTFTRQTRKGEVLAFDERIRLVDDPMRYEATPIGDIPTIVGGMTLQDLYLVLTSTLMPEVVPNTSDITDFLQALAATRGNTAGTLSERYYLGVAAVAQVFGVGANIGGNEDPMFYARVVRPAVIDASRLLGVDPISLDVSLSSGTKAREISIPPEFATTSNELREKLAAAALTIATTEGVSL